MKKISVLTSLYNAATFLPGYFKALSEIQGKEIIEVLLLHNEPKEEELAVIQQHLPSMNFVRHIVIPQREFLYCTWNRGISLSEGEYITVWNVDDIRFPNSILQQAEALDKHPETAIAYGDIYITNTYGEIGITKSNVPSCNYKNEFFRSYYISCFQMWRKSIHSTIGYYDEQFRCSADFDFQIRAALHFPFVKTDEPLGSYLEYQVNKLSFNGLQELENNIIYLRYGVYEKINYFTVLRSLNRYRKNALFFYDEWHFFSEKQPFNFFYRIIRFFPGLILSIKKQFKTRRMKLILRRIYWASVNYGFYPRRLIRILRAKRDRTFLAELSELKRQQGADKSFAWGKVSPVLTEKYEEGGTMRGVYFHQDLYVARLIYETNPEKHLDIGSRTDGFIAHVASFRNIDLINIRAIKSQVKNITFRQADLMNLPEDLIDSYDSISSLHVLEHFGLGRYGDTIDYYGHLKGINNITKILRTSGTFYFSVPMGPQRIEFNEQRVFSLDYLIRILSPDYTIKTFSYVDDRGNFFEDVELTPESVMSNFSCRYGCAIFTLIKK
jgi:SAM-dependent methyltransferase